MEFNLHKSSASIPALGFGTWQLRGNECITSVMHALDTGYRHIDTASMYKNQREIGKAIKQSDVSRDSIFLTSKVWRTELGRKNTILSFDDTLKELQIEYLDLYLIHWPGSSSKDRLESFAAMMELRDEGKIRNIGVSNFIPSQIDEVHDELDEYPAVNQIHFNPFHYNRQNLEYCQKHDIILTAYTPLNKGNGLDHPNLEKIAEKYGKSNAQVLLRWSLDLGVVTIPKAAKITHIEQNFDIFDFELSEEEVDSLKNL